MLFVVQPLNVSKGDGMIVRPLVFVYEVAALGRGLPIALHHELAAIGVVPPVAEDSPADGHVPIAAITNSLAFSLAGVC